MVNSDLLPKDTRAKPAQFQALGIEILGEADDLFNRVKLPQGWHKESSDHAMWSYVLDEKGRKRISVFYKAAFYDRSAHMDLERYYQLRGGYYTASGEEHVYGEHQGQPVLSSCAVFDGEGNKVFETDKVGYADYKAHEELEKQRSAWLDENYPLWQNTSAYWETDA